MGVTQEPLPHSAKLNLIYITEAGEPQNDSIVPVGVLACSGQLKAPKRAMASANALGEAIELVTCLRWFRITVLHH